MSNPSLWYKRRLQMQALLTFEWYRYREVFYHILARELKLKYKRTYFGYLWSLLNPLFQLSVIALVFSHVVGQGIKDYTQYLFSGLLAWNFFQASILIGSLSFLENENFIKKVYLPKILFPMSKVCVRLIDLVFSLVAISILGWVLGFHFYASMAVLPFAVGILFLFTLGTTILVSVALVFFRDVQYLLSVFLQLLYFATPILYPEDRLPEKYRMVLRLNPLLPMIDLFHAIAYEGRFPNLMEWTRAGVVALFVWALALWVLKRYEDELVFRM